MSNIDHLSCISLALSSLTHSIYLHTHIGPIAPQLNVVKSVFIATISFNLTTPHRQ